MKNWLDILSEFKSKREVLALVTGTKSDNVIPVGNDDLFVLFVRMNSMI